MYPKLELKSCIIILLSSAFLAFGLYHVHSLSGITEGGVLGMTLLLEHWLNISPAVSGFILNALCYLIGWKLLGKLFIVYSIVAASGFSIAYKIWEQFDPLWPKLAEFPLAAAIYGSIFVGIGAGICVRFGAAAGGDDALAMSIFHLTKQKIEWIYLMTDLLVLGLSLSYIQIQKIIYSILTVILSGQIIGFLQRL